MLLRCMLLNVAAVILAESPVRCKMSRWARELILSVADLDHFVVRSLQIPKVTTYNPLYPQ